MRSRSLLALTAFLLFAPSAVRAELGINAYGDIGYEVDHATNPSKTTNTFSAPRLELFLQETEGRLTFLAETMFEVGGGNAFDVDMERIEVGYLFADYFRVRAGRFHTAIGYYNDAYHH